MIKSRIVEIAKQKGFTLWATIDGGNRLQFMDQYGINLWVNVNDDSFELGFIVPYSVFELHCPNCSPFGGKHFDNMYDKFKTTVLTKWGTVL